LVVDKPTGLSTHGAHPGDLGVAEWWALHRGESLHVCSRLDKGTSGVLPLARTPAASAEAERLHASGAARKSYSLIVEGTPPAAAWTAEAPLDGIPALTRFRVTESRENRHRLRAEITRGLRHQIRRHAAQAGVPVVGDREYGGRPFARLCLHCEETVWPEVPAPWRSPEPASFAAALRGAEAALAVAAERRGHWLDAVTDAQRLLHRGEWDGAEVSVERYGEWLLVAGYAESISAREWEQALAGALQSWSRAFGLRGGRIRTHLRDPHHRKLFADSLAFGEPPPTALAVREHGLRFEVSLQADQHPGLFLDQRDNRRRLGRLAAGARVANLFAFTCSFSSVAAEAGAEVVFSVDLAAGALERGARTFALNGLDRAGRGKFVREDVRDWLARQRRRKAREGAAWKGWDQMVCDPPVFAGGGAGAFSVEREWPRLAEDVADLLAPGGTAFFSNNHQGGQDPAYRESLQAFFSVVEVLTPPLDFPALPGRPPGVRQYRCGRPRRA
jgi:23S rRNA (cytosine1962-C5)-methyltransferase